MKILEVVLSLSSGGAERLVVDLCNEMSLHHDVTLLCLKPLTGKRAFYKNELNERVKLKSLNFEDGFHICYEWKVYQYIKKFNPDVVHIHSACTKYCYLTMVLPLKSLFCITIHNDIKVSYIGFCSKFFIGLVGRRKRFQYVTISQTNFDDFNLFYPKNNNTLINNGRNAKVNKVLLPSIQQEIDSYKQNNDTKVFIHVARFAEQKNQSLLVDSFNKWSHNKNAVLLILGAGFDSEKGKLLQEKMGPNIKYLGERSDICTYMSCCDAFVLTSLFEGMPITVLEALMVGLPVLSTPVCGVLDVVKSGHNGVISKEFTLESCIEMFDKFLFNYDSIMQITQKEKDKLPYDINNCAKKYMALFNEHITHKF